jgi:hypothetical protein
LTGYYDLKGKCYTPGGTNVGGDGGAGQKPNMETFPGNEAGDRAKWGRITEGDE